MDYINKKDVVIFKIILALAVVVGVVYLILQLSQPKPMVQFTSPTAGESSEIFHERAISWQAENIRENHTMLLSIRSMTRGGWQRNIDILDSAQIEKGEYLWNGKDVVGGDIIERVAPGTYKFVATIHNGPICMSPEGCPWEWWENGKRITQTESPSFVIKAVDASIEIVQPISGEVWKPDSNQLIQWKTMGSVSVPDVGMYLGRIDQTLETCAQGSVIATQTPNTGTFNWTVPNISCYFQPGKYRLTISGYQDQVIATREIVIEGTRWEP